MNKSKESLFYEQLRNIFIGAEIEGQGGFINLMKIKSNYYKKIETFFKMKKVYNEFLLYYFFMIKICIINL